ncbi:MAG: PAS domain-containing protein [Desulfobacterales bacterium]
MARKLTYNELEHTVKELEKEFLEYKNAKESVFRAKEQLERMFNAVPDHIAIINRHYRIQIANKSLADKLGCPQERLVGELCYKHICRANRPPASCLHAKMLNDGKEHLAETYNRHLEMNLLITSSPLYDDEGKLIGGVHVARDITTHKETEKALRQSEEKGDLDL